MYNENEQNNQNNYEYHYSYRPDYTEPLPSPEPTQSTQPQKPSRHGKAKRIVAGVLAGVLVAGAAFGGGWWVNNWVEANQVNETSIQVSNRPSVEVTPVNVDGTTPLTYTQIYQANVDSCVSINVSSNYNFFGQVVQSASSGSGFIITDDGYIVEGKVPMASLQDLNLIHDNVMRAGVYRAEFSLPAEDGELVQEWISWIDPKTEAPDYHVDSSFGEFRFLQ